MLTMLNVHLKCEGVSPAGGGLTDRCPGFALGQVRKKVQEVDVNALSAQHRQGGQLQSHLPSRMGPCGNDAYITYSTCNLCVSDKHSTAVQQAEQPKD